jgi:hypothetical protein
MISAPIPGANRRATASSMPPDPPRSPSISRPQRVADVPLVAIVFASFAAAAAQQQSHGIAVSAFVYGGAGALPNARRVRVYALTPSSAGSFISR